MQQRTFRINRFLSLGLILYVHSGLELYIGALKVQMQQVGLSKASGVLLILLLFICVLQPILEEDRCSQ